MKKQPFRSMYPFFSPSSTYRAFSVRRRGGAGFVRGMLSTLVLVGALLWIVPSLHLPKVAIPSPQLLLEITIASVTVGGFLLLALRQRQVWAWGLWVIVTAGMLYGVFLT